MKLPLYLPNEDLGRTPPLPKLISFSVGSTAKQETKGSIGRSILLEGPSYA